MSYNRTLALLARRGGPCANTIQALRDMAFSQDAFPPAAWVLGSAAVGDDPPEMYRWDPESVAEDNGSSVLLPTGRVVAGRWLRLARPVAVEADIDCEEW